MRAIVQQTMWAGSLMFDVYFLNEWPGKREAAHFEKVEEGVGAGGPAQMVWSPFEEGIQVEPTLRLPAQALETLRTALDEHGPLTADNLTFIRDAVKTRDRLLTLVEKLAVGAIEDD